jgi:hypothetical protein
MQSQHANDLAGKIQQLQVDRQRHLEAMAAIDRVLDQIGAALEVAPKPAPRDGAATTASGDSVVRREVFSEPRRRGRFEKTGIDSVVDFIRERCNPTTAEINAHWHAEGRKGTANVTILKLLQDGSIRREQDPLIRGSRYLLAEAPHATETVGSGADH